MWCSRWALCPVFFGFLNQIENKLEAAVRPKHVLREVSQLAYQLRHSTVSLLSFWTIIRFFRAPPVNVIKWRVGKCPVEGINESSVFVLQSSQPFDLLAEMSVISRRELTGKLFWVLKRFYTSVFSDDSGWWTGRLRGREGLFPSNYIEKMWWHLHR